MMSIDFSLLIVMSFGWILTLFQFVIPIIAKIGAPEHTLLRKRDYTLKKKVAVILPCFNEGSQAYETIKSICKSDYPRDLIEVIAIDDHSTDDSWDWIQKAVADFKSEFRLRAYRQPENAGKQEAVLRGANMAKDADIFIYIDSDCIFDTRAVAEIVASFTHDRIGAVGGQVKVSNVNDNILTQAQTLQYFYAFDVMKMFENYLRNISCISGCLFAIQKKAFFEVASLVAECNFLGVKFTAGEDRFMTHMLMLNGYETCVNLDACCWTEVPSGYKKFFLQQWRWRRAGIFDYILTLQTIKRHIQIISPFSIINLILPETVNLVLLFSMFYAIAQNLFLQWVLLYMVASVAVLTPIALLVAHQIRKTAPDQASETSPLVLALLIAAWALTGTALCSFLSLFTLDSSSWGTRVSVMKKGIK